MNTVLDLYMDIFNDVVVFSVAKVTKCFEKILFEVIILFLVFQKGKYHPNRVVLLVCWANQLQCIRLESNALVGSCLMSHLPRATLVNMEDGYSHWFLLHWQRWQEDSTYFSLSFSLLSNKSAFGESWNLLLDDSESWICARYATCCSSCICKLSSLWNHMGD